MTESQPTGSASPSAPAGFHFSKTGRKMKDPTPEQTAARREAFKTAQAARNKNAASRKAGTPLSAPAVLKVPPAASAVPKVPPAAPPAHHAARSATPALPPMPTHAVKKAFGFIEFKPRAKATNTAVVPAPSAPATPAATAKSNFFASLGFK